jgi:hypothetical protein
MTERELVALLKEYEVRATGYRDDETAQAQAKALNYYYGRPNGREVPGGSTATDTVVSDEIDWLMPAIMRVFGSTDDLVGFEPQGPEDEEAAKQAAEYCRFVLWRDNDGWRILHDAAQDGLLQKVGVAKVYWTSRKRVEKPTFYGIDPLALEAMIAEGAEIQASNPRSDGLFDVELRIERTDGRVCIAPVPTDQFLVAEQSANLEQAPYVAHHMNVTREWMIGEGFDPAIVDALPAYGMADDVRVQARFDSEGWVGSRGGRNKRYKYCEEYVRVDLDGSGLEGLRLVKRVENTILSNEPVDDHPFVAWSPSPMAHKVFGLSVAEKLFEVQDISTALLRGALDATYLALDPRVEVPMQAVQEDGSTLADLQQRGPGVVIRTAAPGLIREVSVGDGVAQNALAMMRFIDERRELRTGVSRMGNGENLSTLRQTATGTSLLMQSANDRRDFVLRCFGEMFVRGLYRKMLRLLSAYQDRPRMIRLEGKWVEMDPRRWNAEMDVFVSVTPGAGNQQEAVARSLQVLEVLRELVPLGMASAENVRRAVSDFLGAMGKRSPELYISEPDPNRPDPAAVQAEQELKTREMSLQAEAAATAQKLAMQERVRMAEIAQDAELKRAQMEAEFALKREQMEAEIALAQQKMALAGVGTPDAQNNMGGAIRFGGEVG